MVQKKEKLYGSKVKCGLLCRILFNGNVQRFSIPLRKQQHTVPNSPGSAIGHHPDLGIIGQKAEHSNNHCEIDNTKIY